MSVRADAVPVSIKMLRDAGILREIDLYLAEALVRRFDPDCDAIEIWLGICLASRVLADGHICLDLADVTPAFVSSLAPDRNPAAVCLPTQLLHALERLRSGTWRAHPTKVIGQGQSMCPFVEYHNRLYLRRYWQYEKSIADTLLAMADDTVTAVPFQTDNNLLLNERQSFAVAHALQSRLTIISGGPGTGKTHTAARILYLLSKVAKAPVIRLAAPTGKAADRLNESVRKALASLPPVALPEPASTIDRLLGFIEGSPYYRHNKDHRLRADVVLIDEASMVDLPKMAKLLEALPDHCRLVLLGDMHQLASVAPGSVMGDLCSASAIAPCVVELLESRRFESGGHIDTLSRDINAARDGQDADTVWSRLQDMSSRPGDACRIQLRETPASLLDQQNVAHPDFAADIIRGYKAYCDANTAEDAFRALAQFRVLCAMRRGPHGVETVNRIVEDILAGKAVRKDSLPADIREWRPLQAGVNPFYDHRPIMITRNDYSMQLFNGDIGVILPDPANPDTVVACFESKGEDAPYQMKSESDGGHVRRVPCRLLPEHETAFATTVHKSQGSEFDQVLVLLPVQESPVVTKELIYTAITRTRNGIQLWCRESAFKHAVTARVKRSSGLRDQLDVCG
jgi:exodeoxyribonuclease V alpha subunit